jgi:hypothetical protein
MCTQQASHDRESWRKFCASRLEFLKALGDVVEQGFIRRDTKHQVFCGCIDWHSSVHGAYALLAAARLAGHDRWAEVVDRGFTTKCLDAEWESLQQGDLEHELPYGFAWFLKLAIEREQEWGKTDLVPLAREIASRLEKWLISLSDEALMHHAQRREYGNVSWALLNLWEWSQWRRSLELCEKLRAFTRLRIVPLDEALPHSYDNFTDEFFAASLQRARVILCILTPEEAQAWLASIYPKEYCLEPLKMATTPHSAGLNFSRAWGYWTLFKHTGNDTYRKLYVDHILTHMQLPECWRDDYRHHAHWVPQFGIYAIALSVADGPI